MDSGGTMGQKIWKRNEWLVCLPRRKTGWGQQECRPARRGLARSRFLVPFCRRSARQRTGRCRSRFHWGTVPCTRPYCCFSCWISHRTWSSTVCFQILQICFVLLVAKWNRNFFAILWHTCMCTIAFSQIFTRNYADAQIAESCQSTALSAVFDKTCTSVISTSISRFGNTEEKGGNKGYKETKHIPFPSRRPQMQPEPQGRKLPLLCESSLHLTKFTDLKILGSFMGKSLLDSWPRTHLPFLKMFAYAGLIAPWNTKCLVNKQFFHGIFIPPNIWLILTALDWFSMTILQTSREPSWLLQWLQAAWQGGGGM